MCADEGVHQPAPTEAPQHEQHGPGHSAPSDAPAGTGDVPETPVCCEAMTACVAGFEMTASAPGDAPLTDEALASAELLDAPRSRPAAPEPPPPRA